jgi:hypothetical protein
MQVDYYQWKLERRYERSMTYKVRSPAILCCMTCLCADPYPPQLQDFLLRLSCCTCPACPFTAHLHYFSRLSHG